MTPVKWKEGADHSKELAEIIFHYVDQVVTNHNDNALTNLKRVYPVKDKSHDINTLVQAIENLFNNIHKGDTDKTKWRMD